MIDDRPLRCKFHCETIGRLVDLFEKFGRDLSKRRRIGKEERDFDLFQGAQDDGDEFRTKHGVELASETGSVESVSHCVYENEHRVGGPIDDSPLLRTWGMERGLESDLIDR